MSLRAKVVASIAVASSAFLLAPAAAQAATHPVQVTGAKLKSALLPASTFGSGFKLVEATGSGKTLWHQKATKHVPTMSCANFEIQGLTRYGESAAAASAILNSGTTEITSLSNLNLLYEQTVYQFPSTKAAATFYNQAHAKYAACKSFSEKVTGNPDDDLTITLKSIANNHEIREILKLNSLHDIIRECLAVMDACRNKDFRVLRLASFPKGMELSQTPL